MAYRFPAILTYPAESKKPKVIEYVKNPPTRAKLVELLAAMSMSPKELLWERATLCRDLGWTDRLEATATGSTT